MLSTILILWVTSALEVPTTPSEKFYEFATSAVIKDKPVTRDEPLSTARDGLKLELIESRVVVENKVGLGMTPKEAEAWLKTIPDSVFPAFETFQLEVKQKIVPIEDGGAGLSVNAAVLEAFIKLSPAPSDTQIGTALETPNKYSASLTAAAQEAMKTSQEKIIEIRVNSDWLLPNTGSPFFWQLPQHGFQDNGMRDLPRLNERHPASFPRGPGFIE